MRGRYFTNLVLIGLFPLLMVAGGAYYMNFIEKGTVPSGSTTAASLESNLQAAQSRLSSIGQALVAGIQKTYTDIVSLATQPTNEACLAFLSSHPGVTAGFMLAVDGRVEKVFPDGSTVVDAQYASTDEFKNIAHNLFTAGKNPYQFFTGRLPYPAFIFTSPTPGKSIVGAVLNLEAFFTGLDLKGGEVFLLEAVTGRYFFHSNKAKMVEIFNASQEAWLTKVQEDLKNKLAGRSVNGTAAAAIYYPLGIAAFGIVQVVPYASMAPLASPRPALSPQRTLQELLLTPLSLSLCVALAWVLIVGSLRVQSILKPLQKVLKLLERAASGAGAVTDADIRAIGTDEPGKIVAAAAQWARRLEGDRDNQVKERDEEMRRTKTNLGVNLDSKTKELNSTAQLLSQSKTDLEQTRQNLADKIKELEAMKGMADGLRTQTEQTKGESSKLKTQIAGFEQKQEELQGKLANADAKLKDMEAKLLKSVSASSAIQVSQVRVAAIKTMAEELKTTLGIIKGYVSSALGSAAGGITEKQQEFLGMVINRSARLEKFINDLMDIYLVEIEQETAPREDVNLASEIEGLAFNYQPQADIKGLKIQVESKAAVPRVPVVRRRFTQLWNILYLQMIKDAPRNTTLSIVVEPIGEDVKVSVHDPGLLVKDEHMPKVFDEFYDPKHPASTQLAGTGLKFALVKTILAAHGGGAVAEKANPGTLLILTFPTKIRKKGEIPPPAPATATAVIGTVMPKPVVPAASTVPPPAMPLPRFPGSLGQAVPAGSSALPQVAPGVKIPTFGAPPASAAPSRPPAPTVSSGALDEMLRKPLVPSLPSSVTKPLIPSSPGQAAPSVPSPTIPSPTGVAGMPPPRPAVPTSQQPGVSSPAIPPAAKPTPAPPSAAPRIPTSLSGGIDALLGKTEAPPSVPAPPPKPAGSVSGAPPPPAPGSVKPPVPPPPPVVSPKPPVPAPSAALPPPVAPPSAGKVVPTSLKPASPPPGILDMEGTDSFKLDAPAAPKPGPPPTSPAPPKSVIPPPGSPPAGGKPIVKDISKEGSPDGELID